MLLGGDVENEVSVQVYETLIPVLVRHLEPLLDREQRRDARLHLHFVTADIDTGITGVDPLHDDLALDSDVAPETTVHLGTSDAHLAVADADVLVPVVGADRRGVPRAAGVHAGEVLDGAVGVSASDCHDRADRGLRQRVGRHRVSPRTWKQSLPVLPSAVAPAVRGVPSWTSAEGRNTVVAVMGPAFHEAVRASSLPDRPAVPALHMPRRPS
ncbi:hypothetical protein DEJ36_13845 [Curtobacterium sp. MCPF17_052]|nr:hypothetical protein [Curtobacterium sp. MCPF17_052]WIB11930.1 hypothetical protein DEJ36_13845 [Curtobacterium sp. MCPF17_052]